MTPEELKAAAEVMRRASEGEPVEGRHRGDGDWGACPEPGWDWFYYEYRIAPQKPREWWGVAWADHKCVITEFPERRDAEAHIAAVANRAGDMRLVHVMEVLS